jgi:A/G-specific adenine glycosylase
LGFWSLVIMKRISPSEIQRPLLRWFQKYRRDLPWRRSRDPYAIWVSEVMLQQTQVSTVIPYFERFLNAFPSVAALAEASEESILRLWEGLGYYRRARNLHATARLIVANHSGEFPMDPDVLRRLPGLGRYSVGAILSQAFDLPLPIVEANSRRVLCRLFGYRGDPRKGVGMRWLWRLAEEVVPQRHAGNFNQALMELGALVCSPVAPRCISCPVGQLCRARKLGLQERIPPRLAAPPVVAVEEVAVVVWRGKRVLLVQRPAWAERWASMWEFPHGPMHESESRKSATMMASELTGLSVEVMDELVTLRHSVTRHQIRIACFSARYRSGRYRSSFYRQARWLAPTELSSFPVSAPQRRLAHTVLAASG